ATDYAGIIWRWSYHPEATGSTEPFLSQMDAVICGRPSAVMWPSAGPGASPVLHLFGRAPDGSLLHWSTGAGLGIINPSENLGGTATSPPAVTAWAGGRLDVFGEAPDHSVCHWWLGDAGWGLEGLPA